MDFFLFSGVEEVITDCRSHKVVVKGEKADPLKVLARVQRKSHRQVELISPIPKPPAEEEKKPEEKEPPKPEEKKEEVRINSLRISRLFLSLSFSLVYFSFQSSSSTAAGDYSGSKGPYALRGLRARNPKAHTENERYILIINKFTLFYLLSQSES